MKDKKLFILLRELSKDELEHFENFLHSPFHNKDKQVKALWACIKGHAPDFEEADVGYYAKYAHLYEKQSSIDKLFSKTAYLLEDCLGHLAFREAHLYRKHLILKELLRLKALREFRSLRKSEARNLERKPIKGKEDYYHKFLLDWDQLSYMALSNATRAERAKHIIEALKDLDISYLLHKLPLSVELENLKKFGVKIEGESTLQQAIEKELEGGWQSDIPVVHGHYLAAKLIVHEQKDDFQALMDFLDEHRKELPREELFIIYTFAINFCIRMLREKKDGYTDILFELYQTVLRLQVLDTNAFIEVTHFRNMVAIGGRLKKFEETKALIHEFKEKVNDKFKESLIHSLFGIVAHREKDYEEALLQLHLMQQNGNAIYKVDAQFIRLKVYYEQWSPNREVCFFSTELHNFKNRVLKVKDLSESQKEAYKNFSKVVGPMYKLKTDPNSRYTVKKIQTKLDDFERVADKNWVLAQLELLA